MSFGRQEKFAVDRKNGSSAVSALGAWFQNSQKLMMRDSRSKELLWESLEWGPGERTAILPKRTLDCPSVTREILFTSEQKIENLSLIQRVIYHGEILEEWRFQFGFVIPRSENTWQNEIERDAQYIPASELSGKTVIETLFMEGGTCIHRSSVRLYYE